MHASSLCRCLAASLLLLLCSPAAWADLVLFPTRVVFEGRQGAAQIELMNQGKSPETYRLNMVNRRMGENGEFIAIETPGPGEQFADALVRFSPRQVTIAPGGSQVVRLQLRKPADLAPGEYRSHLQIDRVAEASGSSSVESVAQRGAKEMGVVIQALVGASIPVIVRHGELQATVGLSELSLIPPSAANPGGMLALKMSREGNRSVYGDLLVTLTTAAGVTLEVAKAGGVAVYAPNAVRRARLPLQLPAGTPMPGGTLKLTYRERPEAGGKLLAEASLTLP
ncbi:molecular chaperone [Pelomonas sp. V22]|uniref:fimbrial biogenesis chaperone n=1 Tax=Pelomonas sp. V22 TaxID=2822139 RepID=UPI0024A8D1A7|nr:molecular chaperone [Pelomonas sp. V22]MDI4631615.1 molecular chaperone [Pelomonas sp. V22]